MAGDLRALNSRYVLTPVGNGVRLEYTGKLDSGFALFGAIVGKRSSRRVPPSQLTAAAAAKMTAATSFGRDSIGTWLVGSDLILALIFSAIARWSSG